MKYVLLICNNRANRKVLPPALQAELGRVAIA